VRKYNTYSLFERLCSISKNILIEDGDLNRDIIIDHMSKFSCNTLKVYDLSNYLRLSINHIYWITCETDISIGEKIWPK